MVQCSFLFVLFSIVYLEALYSDAVVVNLPNGKIRGSQAQTPRKNMTYYYFMGIPYAAPPVGKLRFQPPQPVPKWNGTLDATSLNKICYQTALDHAKATEDCLYINIYTPVKPGTSSNLPVLINIHGGTFIRGSASRQSNYAQYVLEHDVVVATINYRLGPFGFLSTLDKVIPGNYGLKDQQFALQWLQKNIQIFGGDPRKVTLMGQSAGSASVTYQLLSRRSQGLFRAAIGQSGSALCTWAHQRHPVDTAYGIAKLIDPTFNRNRTSQELLEFLLKVDARAIHKATMTYKIFSPVIEVEHENAFITEPMYVAAEKGNVVKVPVLMGICSEEALFVAKSTNIWLQQTKKYDQDLGLLVDEDMGITNATKMKVVGENIRKIYTNGLFQNDLGKAVQYFGDNRFMRAIIKYAELQSKHSDVYFYQFSYHGKMGENNISVKGAGRVTHAEDLYYFWALHPHLGGLPAADIKTMDRYITLLTNFAKNLNPTPNKEDLLQNVTWPKLSNNKFPFLDINENLSVMENPRSFSFSKWVKLFDTYAAKPIISY